MRLPRLVAYLGLLIALTGCQVDLFTKQTEADANEMVAALLENDIPVEKATIDAGKTWNVRVEESQVVRSLAVLRSYGLPQERHVTLGEMFKKEGLISTPTEERVRFIYGVAQQLESTLSQIDGVVTARVHIVLPNNDPLASTVKPASASVFLKHRQQVSLEPLVPSIKNMVSRSVEGLSYENVTVTLVAGLAVAPAPPLPTKGSVLWLILALAVSTVLLAVALAVWWFKPGWLPAPLRRSKGSPGATTRATGAPLAPVSGAGAGSV